MGTSNLLSSINKFCCNNPEKTTQDNEMNTAHQFYEIQTNQLITESESNNAQFFLSKVAKPNLLSPSHNSHFNYIESIKKVYSKSPCLTLETLNSHSLEKGVLLTINPLGLEQSLRNNKDGFSYFGFEEDFNQIKNTHKATSKIDYSIKPKESNYENRYLGLHFQIFFNPNDLKYYIQDLGFGFGTFMKLAFETKINDNCLINIGNSYLVFTFSSKGNNEAGPIEYPLNTDDESNQAVLNIKLFSGNVHYDPSSFYSNLKKVIYLGRDSECDMMIDDSLLSRCHCTVEYKKDRGWYLTDGKVKGRDTKQSTNGSWIYLMDETMIYDDMIFRGNQNIFKCRYIINKSLNIH